MRKHLLFLIPACVTLALSGCIFFNRTTNTPSAADLASFQKVYMSSYYAERGGVPEGSKGLTPFLKVSRGSQGAKTTINTSLLTDAHFASLAPTSFTNYPEPGQTTTFTISTKDSANHVYDIVATTTYPSDDIRMSYVEEYYVMDGNPTWGTGADGIWDVNDAIVTQSGSSWVQDQKARVKQVLTFTDGTTRTETIIAQTKDWGLNPPFLPKFASFDVNGSLDFSQLFYPAETTDSRVRFSSVVMYYVTPSSTTNYWFWQGTQAKTILGIRYYTEYWDTTANTFNGYTISFEKTLDTLTTTGGSFTQTLSSVFAGSQFNTLAESVLRQQVSYSLDASGNLILSTGQKATNMQTRVADITSDKDFYLQQMNDDYVNLSSWTTTTIYTPTGSVNEVVASDPTAFLYSRTQAVPSSGIPLAVPAGTADNTGTGDLATLYTAITEGAVTVSTGTTIPGSIQPAGVEWQYSGSQGTTIPDTPSYDLSTKGTIEAWVYIKSLTDTGGIVHKGDLADFSDECFSLQFWGNQGQVAFVIDPATATGSGGYYLRTSSINLNIGKWYYLVATWDATASTPYASLYINGQLDNGSASPSSPTAASITARVNASTLVVGSQLPVTYDATYGYFGFNGKINGVKVYNTAVAASTVAANYAAYVTQTVNW
ncbi:MAG: LamG domain-containing protein [Spirochaetia bacterium]|jgi:hypothetical protein